MLTLVLAPLLITAELATAVPSGRIRARDRAPAFFLAGDSTTAVNGGWGDGLLATLIDPATGLNVGRSGATTASFVNDGSWSNVTDHVKQYVEDYDVYVTISVRRHDILPLTCQ